LRNIFHVIIISKILREKSRHIAMWNESQTERVVVRGLLNPTLVEASEVRETDLLDEVCGGGELSRHNRQGAGGFWSWDMVEEFVRKEIPVIWLTRDAPHGDKVGGVDAISEELKPKSWSEWLSATWSSS
jgi:hypothetical protein